MKRMTTAATRKPLPLSEKDLQDLVAIRESAAHQAALSMLSDVEVCESASEASLLHSIFVAGLKAVEEQVEADGYRKIAEESNVSERQAVARRRKPTWADE